MSTRWGVSRWPLERKRWCRLMSASVCCGTSSFHALADHSPPRSRDAGMSRTCDDTSPAYVNCPRLAWPPDLVDRGRILQRGQVTEVVTAEEGATNHPAHDLRVARF